MSAAEMTPALREVTEELRTYADQPGTIIVYAREVWEEKWSEVGKFGTDSAPGADLARAWRAASEQDEAGRKVGVWLDTPPRLHVVRDVKEAAPAVQEGPGMFDHGAPLGPVARWIGDRGWQLVPTRWHIPRDGGKPDMSPLPDTTCGAPWLDADAAAEGFARGRLHLRGGPDCTGTWAKPGLRPPPTGVLFDVDHGYSGKTGADTIARMVELLGPLPPTWSVTARGKDSPSRRLAFRKPADLVIGDALFAPFGGCVEAIHTGYRFSWTAPAIHTRNGAEVGPVVWYGPDGEPCDLPHVDDLPELPIRWVEHAREVAAQAAEVGDVEPGTVREIEPDHADAIVGKMIRTLHDLEPAGGLFRSTAYRLSQCLARREKAHGRDPWSTVPDLMAGIFSEHPHGLTLDDDDERWMNEGIAAGIASPWRFIRRPGYCRVSDPDDVRWLQAEVGRGALSGVLRRGTEAVVCARLGEDGYSAPADVRDSNGPATLGALGPDRLAAHLAARYDVTRLVKDKETDEMVEVSTLLPAGIVRVALGDLDLMPNLRRLDGITHTPIPRADGTVLAEPGYDPVSRFLLLPDVDVPPVPERPSRTQVGAATSLLLALVAEFDWVGDHDRANYLGLMLTPILRLLCPPPYKLGVIDARQPGSGKSLLAELIRIVHGGVFRVELPADDAELGKVIMAVLNTTTAPVVVFDNVTGLVKSGKLAGLLTTGTYTDRILGVGRDATVPNDRLWTITANNAALGGDLARRHVLVSIDPGVPNPEARTFAIADLAGYVRAHRGEILAALLTLVRAWAVAGAPVEPAGSDGYARWVGTVRGILTVAGVTGTFDHASSRAEVAGEDDDWAPFLRAVHEVFGTGSWTVAELLARVGESMPGDPPGTMISPDALPGDLADRHARGGAARPLGLWLRNRRGRWVDRLSVVEAGTDSHLKTRLWEVRTPST